jgi:hypothetical protein
MPFKCNIVEEGRIAFVQWLNSNDKKSKENPIVLTQFVNGKQALLYDTFLEKSIIVEIKEGAPFCNYCKLNDCAHVGFTICIQQLYNCDGERNRCEI